MTDQRRENRQALFQSPIVPVRNFGRSDSQSQQLLGALQQGARQDDDEVRPVADLRVLHLAGEDDQLRGGVLHVQLAHDGRGVARHEVLLQMVDHHLVHAVRTVGGSHGRREFLARAYVAKHRFFESGKVLKHKMARLRFAAFVASSKRRNVNVNRSVTAARIRALVTTN